MDRPPRRIGDPQAFQSNGIPPPDMEGELQLLEEGALPYAEEALNRSKFFSELAAKAIALDVVAEALVRYFRWRNRFHEWHGHLIKIAGDCSDRCVERIIQAAAHHVFEEMRDGHTALYRDLLRDVGMTDAQIDRPRTSPATTAYVLSFQSRFGPERLLDGACALAGRELLAAPRNQRLGRDLLSNYGVGPFRWIDIHCTLERDHFRAAISPLVGRLSASRMLNLMKDEMDLQIRYWDALRDEAKQYIARERLERC